MNGPTGSPGILPSNLLDPGQAAGDQAQTGILLQLIRRITQALESGVSGAPFFRVYPVTAAGDLDIGAQYPNATSGSFSIRQTVAAPIQVTLPATNGPWFVVDGAGVASGSPITVIGAGGNTILGVTSYVISSDWGGATFILDGSNFVLGYGKV